MTASAKRSEEILDIIAEQGMIERSLLADDATLDDLGIQSIDFVMILNELEDKFGVYIPIEQSLSEIKNVGEMVSFVTSLIDREQARTVAIGKSNTTDG